MLTENKKQKIYLNKLKRDIISFLLNYKKRYKLFPWSQVNKISKLYLNSQTPITVNGTDYTVKELVKEITKIKVRIHSKMKPSAFNNIIRAYMKESSKCKSDDELKMIYNEYNDALQISFKKMKLELEFCLDGLKELNKALKDENKIAKESMIDLYAENVFFDTRDLYKNFNKFESGDKLSLRNSYKSKGFKNIKHEEDYYRMQTDDTEEITEACKDVKSARKFVSEVRDLSKKYDANYFIVTDGASGIHNNGNPAVKNARDSQIEWEKKNKFDPYEDWLEDKNKNVKECTITENGKNTGKEKFFEDFKSYIKTSGHNNNIKPLNHYMIHKTKKEEEWMLLATFNEDISKKEKAAMSKHLSFNGSPVELHSCYLPGDMFLYVELPDKVEEGGEYYNMTSEFNDELYEEGIVDVAKGAVGPLNNGINRATNKVARTVIRKPAGKLHPSEYENYEKKIAKFRAKLKLVTLATIEAGTSIIPLFPNTLFTALVYSGIKTSEDPSDKVLHGYLKGLETRAKKLKTHVDKFVKEINTNSIKSIQEYKKRFGLIDMEAKYVAKQIDAAHEQKQSMINESTDYGARLLGSLTRNMTMSQFEEACMFVENVDICNTNEVQICERVLDMLFSDINIIEGEEYNMLDEYEMNELEYFMKECYAETLEFDALADIYSEGANIDNAKTLVNVSKDFTKLTKAYRKNCKDGDFTEARKNVKELEKIIKDAKKEVKATQGDVVSSTLGVLVEALIIWGRGMAIMLPGTVGVSLSLKNFALGKPNNFIINGIKIGAFPIGIITNYVLLIKDLIEHLVQISNNMKNSDEVSADDFNLFKNQILISLDNMSKIIKLLSKHVDKLEDLYNEKKKEEEVKESVAFEDAMTMKFINKDGQLEDARNVVIDIMEAMAFEDIEDESEEFTEGANLESRRAYKEMKKSIKLLVRKYKNAMANMEYDDARDAIKKISAIVDKTEKEIKATNSTTASIGFGYIASSVLSITRLIYGLIPVAGAFVALFKEIKYKLDELGKVCDNIKKSDDITADEFNPYKNYLLVHMNSIKKDLKQFEKMINEEEKLYKKSRVKSEKEIKMEQAKEEFEADKMAIYEACHNGEITLEEREELLKDLQDSKFLTTVETAEDTYEEIEESGISNKEKFDRIKLALYEKCSNGEITVEERENLVVRAHERFISESENITPDKSTEIDSKKLDKDVEKISKQSEKDLDKNLRKLDNSSN